MALAGLLVLLFLGITLNLLDLAADVLDREGREDMKLSIPAVNAYLRQCSAAVERGAGQRLRFVMGNEASDLDSIISALFYASWVHLDRDQALEQGGIGDDGNAHTAEQGSNRVLTIPLMNIPRDDFPLRTEAVYVLDKAGVEHGLLLFLDDVSDLENGKWTLQRLREGIKLDSVILVDHNRLAAHQRGLAPLVKEVVDHHIDETSPLIALESRNLNPTVGSAATIVAERVLSSGSLDDGCAEALLSTILIDTIFFNEEARRTSALDRSIATSLTKLLLKESSISDQSVEDLQGALYSAVNDAKLDISGLSSRDLLRKDYKQWQLTIAGHGVNFGFGSVMLSLDQWMARDHKLATSLDSFCAGLDLQLLLVLCSFMNAEGEFTRMLVVYAPPGAERYYTTAVSCMTAEVAAAFKKTPSPLEGPKDSSLGVFHLSQTFSRKKVSPIVSAALAAIK